MSKTNPFVPDAGVDKPGIIGARWWNEAIKEATPLAGRRNALKYVVIGGGVIAFGAMVWGISRAARDDDEEYREEGRRSLQLQRDYGWNFGAVSETVAFDTKYTQTYAREALAHLITDLQPTSAYWKAQYVSTLFESPEAMPKLSLPDGETSKVRPLAEALKPIKTPSMVAMEMCGRAYAELISQADQPVLTIVDLPGPEAVAFAAGAASLLEPVFLFDNWPHPRGVVPAHLTLAAAVYYQPVFAKAKSARGDKSAMPIAVIDRARLNSYVDEASQFDNRYVSRLAAGIGKEYRKILYVVPTPTDLPEKDDLNGLFMALGGAEVRAIAASAFHPAPVATVVPAPIPPVPTPAPSASARPSASSSSGRPPSGPAPHSASSAPAPSSSLPSSPPPSSPPSSSPDVVRYIFGTSEEQHSAFFAIYPWKKPAPPAVPVPTNEPAEKYKPTSRNAPLDTAKIGVVPVVLAVGTGLLLGAKINRNGSWHRASGGSGG